MIVKLFNCSQADLIIVLDVVLDSYLENFEELELFSNIYTEEWGTDCQAELADAAAMTDEETSRAISEGKRGDLVKLCKKCRKGWQSLKRYINGCFLPDARSYKIKAAGGNYYENASNENWPQAQQMFTNAINFIEANEVALSQKMPTTFKASFEADIALYKQALKVYEQSKEAITENTQARLAALNAIYTKVIEMMKDAQHVFQDNDALRKQFVFSEVLSRVSGAGLAGMRGMVKEAITNTALSGVHITLKDGNGATITTGITDAQGNYVINSASGQYNVIFERSGYISRTIENFTVEVGTVSRLDVALTPVEPEEE